METTQIITKKLDFDGSFKESLGKWAELFRPFIEGPEMYQIYQRLKEDGKKEIICPASENTFRAFQTTDPDQVNVVFLLADPYPRRYKDGTLQSTGIAMDCSNSPTGEIQPSLEKFYDGIERDLGGRVEKSPSLLYLQEQGVMMLNTDLTCKLNKTGSHTRLWEPFQKFFLETVMGSERVIYVLCGKSSHRMDRYIYPPANWIFKLEHPAAAAHDDVEWDHQNIFTNINKILRSENKSIITWDPKEWADLPF
jgi:uracil-DNA glycosylase